MPTVSDDGTLAGQIVRGAETHGTVEIVFDGPRGSRRATVAELVADAERVAGGLQARGVGPGDVVAVQLGSVYEGAVAQAAVALCGAVLLPVVLIYGPRELGFILRQSGAVALVLPGEVKGRRHAATVLGALERPPSLRTVVVVGSTAGVDGAIAFDDLNGALARPTLRPDQRALLVYTSGTTADPKGVQHSHRTLLGEIFSPILQRRLRQLALFPAGHVAGLLGLMRILVHGWPTVVLETWDPGRAAALVDEFALTYGVGAPVQLAGLLDQQARGAATLATLEEFMTGAANVPPALISRAERAGLPAYRCYGSSEHPTISTGVRNDPLTKRANTDGRIIAGSEIRLVDDEGNDVPDGAEGEIASRGPELFLGYTDPALDRDAFLPGRWFRTGDVGRLDGDGYLTITDRKKDIIIRGGENISSKEVEDVLAEHPAVLDVAAVGLPDERMGERVCAVVVLGTGQSLDLDQVREHFAASGLAKQKTPERVEVVTELPRTPAGKVQKYLLRRELTQPR
ncbi:AMP-binding protein [Cryptosporangium aurantiacum]|uniref:Acyl-CoA synthetase (AMP-forming)/AMP-acid ligase II n=1 Tax=Cryptosporangium aurantiacum TaxID=134849 RepID=A0A1M7R461_9ACTN|nr:AMP-binding protein [Cryptosporangium aurantiacum]SHN39851.1 Acyl-CoA synthetase (AMP-forming)/AMP-acid ligase II [Cryptosporangium aurantiacum]